MDQFIEQVVDSLSSGDAILFLGAGFSKKASNTFNSELPTGDELKGHLFKAIGENPTAEELSNELSAIADYCLSDATKVQAVSDYLRKLFTIRGLEEWQLDLITKFPWRRIYTTNYDNAIEFAFDARNRQVAPYSALEPYPTSLPPNALCIHLNGILSHSVKDQPDRTLRLSHVSYAGTRLEGTKWGDLFERDVAYSGASVFVGYRLPDLDIARLLVGEQTKQKIGFVNGLNVSSIARSRLANFGTLFSEDGEGFTKRLSKKFKTIGVNVSPKRALRYFDKFVQPGVPVYANDRDRFALLMYGDLKNEIVHGDISRRRFGTEYTITRSAENDFVEAMERGEDVAIVSRLGNGKTVLLQRLGLKLMTAGWSVFRSKGDSAITAAECSELARIPGKVAVLFDGGIANELAIRALGLERSKHLRIAFTERSARFDTRVSDEWLDGCNIETLFEHRLDLLDEKESDALIDLLNSTGLWGHRSALDPLAKKSFIERDCRSEFASVMLHIVKSADITSRVKESLASENLSPQEKSFLILATAISVTSGEINTTTLAKLSSHSALNEFSRRGSDFRSHLYSIRGVNFSLNSSLFGTFFLRDLVSAREVLEVVAQAVQRAIKSGIGFKPRKYQDDDTYYSNDFPSSLYVFRNLQLLVDTAKSIDAISWFYEEIRRGTNLEEDPLYWLHYAISKFFARDTVQAKVYLDNAYGVARRTPGFLTFQIDNQYSRLLIESCGATGDTQEAYEAFIEAHRIIADQAINASFRHYPFKVAQGYPDVIVFHRHKLTDGQMQFILNAMKLVVSRAKLATVPLDKRRTVEQCIRKLSKALRREGVSEAEIALL